MKQKTLKRSSKIVKVVIKPSTKPEKKKMAVFTKENGMKKTVHFGQAGAPDYTITKDKKQRKRYLSRHKARENWNDPMTAGALSRWILWGPYTSQKENIQLFKHKFKLR